MLHFDAQVKSMSVASQQLPFLYLSPAIFSAASFALLNQYDALNRNVSAFHLYITKCNHTAPTLTLGHLEVGKPGLVRALPDLGSSPEADR